MAESFTFSADKAALLEPRLPPTVTPPGSGIFVTATFTTSLDSSLTLTPGVHTHLSGPESYAMTHYLRSRHAAILVGVSTLLADDPALNCRIAGAGLAQQPRPVVVDPHLRWTPRLTDKVLATCRRGAGRAPLVVTAAVASDIPEAASRVLKEHGGKYIQIAAKPTGPDGRMRFDWNDVFASLRSEGIASVMVEGGGKILNSLLDPAYHGSVDSVIVTIAPTWLGQGGVVVSPARVHDASGSPVAAARLKDVSWHPFGDDIVLCGKLQAPQ